MSLPTLAIAIAVVYRAADQAILITYRPSNAHAGGVGSFPAERSKRTKPQQTLRGVNYPKRQGLWVDSFVLWKTHSHTYPDRIVVLHICLGQTSKTAPLIDPLVSHRWLPHSALLSLPMPAGNRAWLALLPPPMGGFVESGM